MTEQSDVVTDSQPGADATPSPAAGWRPQFTLDRTTLNIVTLMIGGLGIVGALAETGVPERDLVASYFDSNPFALKREVIAGQLAFWFALIAGLALFVQMMMEIWDWPNGRLRTWNYYLAVFLVMIPVSWGLGLGIVHIAKAMARCAFHAS